MRVRDAACVVDGTSRREIHMNFSSVEIRKNSSIHRNQAIAFALTMAMVLCGFFYVAGSANADSPAIATVLSKAPDGDVGKKTVCAYCGMHLTVKSDTPGAAYNGKDYYFCDETERDSFVKTPAQYLSKQPSAGIAAAAKTSP